MFQSRLSSVLLLSSTALAATVYESRIVTIGVCPASYTTNFYTLGSASTTYSTAAVTDNAVGTSGTSSASYYPIGTNSSSSLASDQNAQSTGSSNSTVLSSAVPTGNATAITGVVSTVSSSGSVYVTTISPTSDSSSVSPESIITSTSTLANGSLTTITSTTSQSTSSSSLTSSASSTPSTVTYTDGQNFTTANGNTYTYMANTSVTGTTIDRKRKRQTSFDVFSDCVTECDATDGCLAVTLLGDSCLLYKIIEGLEEVLGALTALDEALIAAYDAQSTATTSGSVSSTSAASSSSGSITSGSLSTGISTSSISAGSNDSSSIAASLSSVLAQTTPSTTPYTRSLSSTTTTANISTISTASLSANYSAFASSFQVGTLTSSNGSSTGPVPASTTSSPTTMTTLTSSLSSSSSPSSSVASSSSSSSSSTTSTTSSASASATPVKNTGKRGLAYTNDTLTLPWSLSGQDSQVSWGYDWYYSRYTGSAGDTTENPAITYIPMLWSNAADLTGPWPTYAQIGIDSGSDALMSFNEPDVCYSGSACMSVSTAVSTYQTYMEPFANQTRLGAPAVTNEGAPAGLTWLGEFLGNCTNCTIDFVPIHWYASVYSFDYLESYVAEAYALTKQYVPAGIPLWVTEFGIDSTGGTDEQYQAFLEQALPYLDGVSYVERYAWFYDGPGYLINANGSGLSAQGEIYNSYT